jgi:hypothetical protein
LNDGNKVSLKGLEYLLKRLLKAKKPAFKVFNKEYRNWFLELEKFLKKAISMKSTVTFSV